MLITFTPKERAKQIVSETYGGVTYEALGEDESLGGIISTRNLLLRIKSAGQTYEFGTYGRPVLSPDKTKIEVLTDSKPVSEQEKVRRRKEYIEYARISGPEIRDYSQSLGEWGDNPRTEPRTRKIREIYVLCNGCKIPVWICDTLEPVLNWGESKKAGIDKFLRKNYQQYIGLPLYRIPSINFAEVDISQFPENEKSIIEQGKLDNCSSLAEQNIILLQEVLKRFGLSPVLIDQRKLREIGAYKKGVDVILDNIEELERRFGKQNLFRVECQKCGKYIYNIRIEDEKIGGVCEGKVKTQRTGELQKKYEGCGSRLEENLDYLYTNAIPNGKILTAIYMSDSDAGIFFPDFEFVPENMATGELEKIILTTGEFFNSGVPKIVTTGWFTKDEAVENIFAVLDLIPAEDIKERFAISPAYRRIDIKQKSIEQQLMGRLKSFNPPTDPRLIADVMYSLDERGIDLKKLNWNVENKTEYVLNLLGCLGRVRKNKVILSTPKVKWQEDYQTFIQSTYVSDKVIENLRRIMVNQNAQVRTIMETAYIATLVKYRASAGKNNSNLQ